MEVKPFYTLGTLYQKMGKIMFLHACVCSGRGTPSLWYQVVSLVSGARSCREEYPLVLSLVLSKVLSQVLPWEGEGFTPSYRSQVLSGGKGPSQDRGTPSQEGGFSLSQSGQGVSLRLDILHVVCLLQSHRRTILYAIC